MNIKKIAITSLSFLVVSTSAIADNIVLENQTSHPLNNSKSRIAIQWAASAREVDEGNKAIMYGAKLKPETMQSVSQQGKNELNIPEKAEYFRILLWTNGQGDPDFLTNWVDVVPDKTYTLKKDHLVPAVLMSGTGC